ncbi:protein of unknown function [Methylotuvimicrobium alcaliphilum 20Z]|uniref:Uncharacterized protein n=1 Tax=Methylotuvimicrobium alcaliphilum (strain DSM 19304 / NCIMB 14124 / VKM B-2133 / 20Z) TaxID=1091494 RepID=G4T095_META2|nr:protein of unknown function [Methylotuvimicrobium alcaliphilum 20Z]
MAVTQSMGAIIAEGLNIYLDSAYKKPRKNGSVHVNS